MEEEQGGADRAQYGKEVIRELATRLTSEFGNGFSKSNLEYMRRFYLAYPGRDSQIAQTLSGQLGYGNDSVQNGPFGVAFEQRNIQVNRDRLAQVLLEQFWGSDLRDENEQVIAIDRVPSLDRDEQRARSVAAADRKASEVRLRSRPAVQQLQGRASCSRHPHRGQTRNA